jgi:hypothetical protein
VAAYAVASTIAVLAILLVTANPETVAVALLVSLFLLPSIVLFVVLGEVAPAPSWKHAGYLVPAIGILTYLLVFVALDLAGQCAEGSGLPAVLAVTFGAPAVVTYLALLRMSRALK